MNDEFMHGLERLFQGIVRQEQEQPARPEFVLPVPDALVDEFYARMERMNTQPEEGDLTSSGLDYNPIWRRCLFFRWLAEVLPATKGRHCKLNADDILSPVVEVHDDSVFSDQVHACYYIPDEEVDRFWHLWTAKMRDQPSSLQAQYRLWSFLARLYPGVRNGSWQITVRIDRPAVVKTVEDFKKEQAEEQRFREELDRL